MKNVKIIFYHSRHVSILFLTINDMICLQKRQVLQTYLDNKAEEEEMVYQLVKAAQEGIQFSPRYMTYI